MRKLSIEKNLEFLAQIIRHEITDKKLQGKALDYIRTILLELDTKKEGVN